MTPQPSPQQNPKQIELTGPDDDFTPLEAPSTSSGTNQTLSLGIPKGPSQGPLDNDTIGKLMNTIRPFISGAAGAGAGTLAGGPVGTVLGGMAGYTGTDLLQKKLTPGREENPLGEEFPDSIKEALINEVGGKIFTGIGAGIKGVRNSAVPEIYKLFPKSSQALENYGYHNLATASKFLEDFGAPKSSAAALDKSGGAGFTQALLKSNIMNSNGRFTKDLFQDPKALHEKITDTLRGAIKMDSTLAKSKSPTYFAIKEAHDLLGGTNNPFQALDDVIGDKTKLQKVLAVGQAVGPKNLNVRKDLQAYYWNRIFDEATTFSAPGKARIDPDKISNLWLNPKKSKDFTENLELLYGKEQKKTLDEFMTNILKTQDAQLALPGIGGKIFKYLPGGFASTALLGQLANLGTLGHAATGATAIFLPTAVMGRLLTNPNVGKFVAEFAKGAKGGAVLDKSQRFISRAIFNSLEGSRVALMDKDGKKEWGTVGRRPDGGFYLEEDK